MLLVSGLMKRLFRTIGIVDFKDLKENYCYVYEFEIVFNYIFGYDYCKSI